jgi:hypothetical protein
MQCISDGSFPIILFCAPVSPIHVCAFEHVLEIFTGLDIVGQLRLILAMYGPFISPRLPRTHGDELSALFALVSDVCRDRREIDEHEAVRAVTAPLSPGVAFASVQNRLAPEKCRPRRRGASQLISRV